MPVLYEDGRRLGGAGEVVIYTLTLGELRAEQHPRQRQRRAQGRAARQPGPGRRQSVGRRRVGRFPHQYGALERRAGSRRVHGAHHLGADRARGQRPGDQPGGAEPTTPISTTTTKAACRATTRRWPATKIRPSSWSTTSFFRRLRKRHDRRLEPAQLPALNARTPASVTTKSSRWSQTWGRMVGQRLSSKPAPMASGRGEREARVRS